MRIVLSSTFPPTGLLDNFKARLGVKRKGHSPPVDILWIARDPRVIGGKPRRVVSARLLAALSNAEGRAK